MSATRLLFTALVALVAGQRLLELRLARRNEKALRARGAVESGAGHYPLMVTLHSLFLVSVVAEVWLLRPPFRPLPAAAMLAVLAAVTVLRYWTIRTLGGRWTTRVLTLPGEPRIEGGPFRFFPHPNYLAVVLEIAALPLVHGAWRSALVFSGANALLLTHRVRVEERALAAAEAAGPEGRTSGAPVARGRPGGAR